MGDAFSAVGRGIGGVARGVPGWAEAAVLPVGVTAEAIKAITPSTPGAAPAATAPPTAPDITDQLVRRARLSAMQRAQQGMGTDSTFLTGPLGLPSLTPASPAGMGY